MKTSNAVQTAAENYDVAALAYARRPTEENRAAKNDAETALLMAQRAAGWRS